MNVLMDSDCLIKIVKSGLKELVCKNFKVTISSVVVEETVTHGKGYPDAELIEQNIRKEAIEVKSVEGNTKGEESVYLLYQKGRYSAICSDDKKFLRKLKLLEIPYITPAVFIAILLKKGKIRKKIAAEKLVKLKPYISDEEYSIVKMYIDTWRKQ